MNLTIGRLLENVTRNIGGEQSLSYLTMDDRLDALEEAYHTITLECQLGSSFSKYNLFYVNNVLIASVPGNILEIYSITHFGCPVKFVTYPDALKLDPNLGTPQAAQGDAIKYWTVRNAVNAPAPIFEGFSIHFLPIPRDPSRHQIHMHFLLTPLPPVRHPILGTPNLTESLWGGYYNHSTVRRAVEAKTTQTLFERMGDRVNFGDARYWEGEYEKAMWKFKRWLRSRRLGPAYLEMNS